MTEARVEPATPALTPRLSSLRNLENAVVSAALFSMILIPLAESFLRRTFHTGIPASTSMVQHMVLVVGMLGGAIAARDGRLLSLSNFGDTHLRGRLKTAARIFGSSVSAAVSGFLCLAAFQFVQTERQAGKILAYGVPVWVIEYVLPVGFAAIAFRILLQTSQTWRARAIAAVCGALLMGVVMY